MNETLPGPDLGASLDLLAVQEGRHILAQLQLTGLSPCAGSGRSERAMRYFKIFNSMANSPDREASGLVWLPFPFPTLVF